MSQASANTDGVPLFACTKCNSRHPFEELSQGSQLCKSCRGSCQIIKCSYCRSEYQLDSGSKSSTRSNPICKKCEHLQEQHGKPGPCAYCNIIAAFIGTKCQRCTNSEKKYGPPQSCENCRQKCAFDRKDPESKSKVENKLLCWLCTISYKKSLAKARQKEAIFKSTIGGHRSSRHHSGKHESRHHRSSGAGTSSSPTKEHHSRHTHSVTQSSHRDSLNSSSFNHNNNSNSSGSTSKKPRLDVPSNGHITSISDTRFIDAHSSSDLTTTITNLKDQVAALNKRLQMKEKELLSKDQQIADLKSTNTREQREWREKLNTVQKQHAERISEMQARLVTMQKQIASQSKASRATTASGYVEPPMVI